MIIKNVFTSLIRKLRTVTMKLVMVSVLSQVIMEMICTLVERKKEEKAQELFINFTVSPQMIGVLKTRLLKCKHQDLMNNGM